MERQHESGHCFLAPGDLSVTLLSDAQGTARFPTGHYHGVTVTLDPKRAPDCLSCILQDVNVRPAMLAEKFCDRSGYFAARSSARVEHIFSELYQVPEAFRMGYFKVKILELLLFLSALELPAGRRSYSGAQVLLARRAAEYLEQNAGGLRHSFGACGAFRRLARAALGKLPGRLRHDARRVPARAENARRGGAPAHDRSDGAGHRRAVRLRQRQQIRKGLPKRHRRRAECLSQRRSLRQLRAGGHSFLTGAEKNAAFRRSRAAEFCNLEPHSHNLERMRPSAFAILWV